MTVLSDRATQLLADLVAAGEACTNVVLPSCRYVSPGPPPLDCCDVMALYFDGAVAEVNGGCSILSDVTWVLELWYCVSTPEFNQARGFVVPDPVVVQGEAVQILDAGYGMYDLFVGLAADADLGESVTAASMERLDPQGGCAGVRINVSVR